MTEVTNIVFFGDSLSDPGNLYALGDGLITEETREALAGPTQSVSDGIVFTEYMELLLEPGTGVYNYAIAGAQTIGTMTLGDMVANFGYEDEILVPLDDPQLDIDVNLGGQVDRFTQDFAEQDLSDFTAFILIGANDYSGLDPSDPQSAIEDAIGQFVASVGTTLGTAVELAVSGVGNVVISTLPAPAFFPRTVDFTPTEAALADLLFSLHNAALNAGVEVLSALGFEVEIVDLRAITDAILDDAESFGLIAPLAEDMEINDGAVLDDFDPDQVAFYDDVHPSTATHGVIGAYMTHAVEGGPIVEGSDGADAVTGGDEGDLVLANAGDDVVQGGDGDDLLFGGADDDTLDGQGGDDLLSGGSGHDALTGGLGNDIMDGDGGDDVMRAGFGDDLLVDGLGSDTALGGFGSDDFVFTQSGLIGGDGAPDDDLFIGGAGFDTLYLVLDDATAEAFGENVSDEELAALGITAIGIEEVVVMSGRDDLALLSHEDWFATADVWGLI